MSGSPAGSRRWCERLREPIEAPSDHRFVVDYGVLVMDLVTARKARAANAFEGLI